MSSSNHSRHDTLTNLNIFYLYRTTSANRSLPDIPKDKGREEDMVESVPQDIYETTETMGDHSELYATVQDAGNTTSRLLNLNNELFLHIIINILFSFYIIHFILCIMHFYSVIHNFICHNFSALEQISEREAQEASQQSSSTQDTSRQYPRFSSPISDNGMSFTCFFFAFAERSIMRFYFQLNILMRNFKMFKRLRLVK